MCQYLKYAIFNCQIKHVLDEIDKLNKKKLRKVS